METSKGDNHPVSGVKLGPEIPGLLDQEQT